MQEIQCRASFRQKGKGSEACSGPRASELTGQKRDASHGLPRPREPEMLTSNIRIISEKLDSEMQFGSTAAVRLLQTMSRVGLTCSVAIGKIIPKNTGNVREEGRAGRKDKVGGPCRTCKAVDNSGNKPQRQNGFAPEDSDVQARVGPAEGRRFWCQGLESRFVKGSD